MKESYYMWIVILIVCIIFRIYKCIYSADIMKYAFSARTRQTASIQNIDLQPITSVE